MADQSLEPVRTLTEPRLEVEPSHRASGTLDWAAILASPLMLPVILLLTFVVFAPTLNDWFFADDFWFLDASRTTPMGEYALEAFDYRDTEPVQNFSFYRPMYLVTAKVCYELFGLNAWAYHLLNIVLHMSSVVLLWLIARRLLQSGIMANAAALIFAIHPAYTETVWWISRGNTVMTTMVYLATLLMFMKYLDGGRRARVWYWASVLGFVLAILYHTTALTLLAVLPAYAFLVAWRPHRMREPRAWLPFAPFLVFGLGMAWIQLTGDVGLDSDFAIGWHQFDRYRAYLGLSLFPVLPGDWTHYELGSVRRLTTLYDVAAGVMILIVLFVAVRSRWPYGALFAVVWLFAALAPNTTATFKLQVTGGIPAQLYLPGAALACVLVLAAACAGRLLPDGWKAAGRWLLYAVLPTLVVGAAVLTTQHQRSFDNQTVETERFIQQLRDEVSSVQPGYTLYVANPPFSLVIFDDTQLVSAVSLYYPGVEVRRARGDLAPIRAQMTEGDRLFVFRP